MKNSSSTKNRSGVNTSLGTALALRLRELHAVQEVLNTATSLQIRIWIWSRCFGLTLFVPVCHSHTVLWVFLLADLEQGCEREPREPVTPRLLVLVSALLCFFFFFFSEQWTTVWAGQTFSKNVRSKKPNWTVCVHQSCWKMNSGV